MNTRVLIFEVMIAIFPVPFFFFFLNLNGMQSYNKDERLVNIYRIQVTDEW